MAEERRLSEERVTQERRLAEERAAEERRLLAEERQNAAAEHRAFMDILGKFAEAMGQNGRERG